MNFNPASFSQIVQDYHYLLLEDGQPKVFLKNLDSSDNCFVLDKKISFQRGLHVVVQLTHRLAEENIINKRSDGYGLYHRIKSSLAFFNSIIQKLGLTEDDMYVRAILAHVIGYEEKSLCKLEERMKELK